MLTLHVEKRDTAQKPKTLREKGMIPAVLYGRKEEATPITVNAEAFRKAWHEAGESTIISLEGVDEPKEALIHDIALHPVKNTPEHVDFYVIEKGKKLHVPVQLVFTGVAPAVKSLGGTLIEVLHEIEIEALPKDLPHEIVVDISSLVDFESTITIADLKLPEGVTPLADAHDAVASVAAPKEAEEESSEAVDISSIEVEKKGKDEEADDSKDAE